MSIRGGINIRRRPAWDRNLSPRGILAIFAIKKSQYLILLLIMISNGNLSPRGILAFFALKKVSTR